MYRTDFWTLWGKLRVGCFKRTASKHVYYLGWNRSPTQAGCMRQVLRAGALGRPRGIGWRGRWERGSGWGIHVYPWLIHVSVWQKPLQYCEVIRLQLIKKILKILCLNKFNIIYFLIFMALYCLVTLQFFPCFFLFSFFMFCFWFYIFEGLIFSVSFHLIVWLLAWWLSSFFDSCCHPFFPSF